MKSIASKRPCGKTLAFSLKPKQPSPCGDASMTL